MSGTEESMTGRQIEEYLDLHRNWGRWGEDDQMGALNLVTPEKRVAAARLIRTGRAVSLGRPFPSVPAPNNRTPGLHFTRRGVKPNGGGNATDFQGMAYHGQTATHIDALCHVWGANGMWGGRDPDAVLSSDGAAWGAIDNWRNGIMTRGVLIDIPAFRRVPYVTHDRPVQGWELFAAAAEQEITVTPGDAVAIACGRGAYEDDNGPWSSDYEARAGLDASCLRFIRETDCAVVLWDMWDRSPDVHGRSFGVHSAIYEFGVAVVDAPLLEPLRDACSLEGRKDFTLTINPIEVIGGTGCLVNPVAVF